MTQVPSALQAHLDGGATTLCHAWEIKRVDGISMGFTDHDLPLEFDGLSFTPDTGLSALALQQSTGLSVDNTEAMGALSDTAICDEDIDAGRFDRAEVRAWAVNWQDVSQRVLLFRGNIGEIRRSGGAFHAELRGLTDSLNRSVGRVYQRPCGAVLGDAQCGLDLDADGRRFETEVGDVENQRVFQFHNIPAYSDGWFSRGVLEMLSGDAKGLTALIKLDGLRDDSREISLWHPIRANVTNGDRVRLTAGCDKLFSTCQDKFSNAVNFQGFPDIPEEEWLMIGAGNTASLSGGSRR